MYSIGGTGTDPPRNSNRSKARASTSGTKALKRLTETPAQHIKRQSETTARRLADLQVLKRPVETPAQQAKRPPPAPTVSASPKERKVLAPMGITVSFI